MWVKWDPADFLNGIVGLDGLSIAIYTVILNLIYDNGGPVRYDEANLKKIARRCSVRFDHFERCLKTLIEERKLIVGDGVLSNARAEKELNARSQKVSKLVSNFGSTVSKRGSTVSKNTIASDVSSENDNKFNAEIIQKEDQLGRKQPTDKNQKENQKERKIAQPRVGHAPASRIDPHRVMTNQNSMFARSRGLTEKETKFEWEKFVRYYRGASGKNATSPDWDAVWESWILRAAERMGREGIAPNGHGSSDAAKDWASIVAVWRLTNNWHPDHGPEPGRPGCLVPPGILS